MKYASPKIKTNPVRKPQNKKIVTCPICYTDNLVFSWSFAGSGKKCQKCKFLMDRHNINRVLASRMITLGFTTTIRLRDLK